MTNRQAKALGMPWEDVYGYAQGIKVDDTIYLSGQVSHDDEGNPVDEGDMEAQMRQAYGNVSKMLAQYGASIEDVLDELIFVTDMQAAFEARVKMKDEVFNGAPVLTSTITQIQALAMPEFMIEIRCIAKV